MNTFVNRSVQYRSVEIQSQPNICEIEKINIVKKIDDFRLVGTIYRWVQMEDQLNVLDSGCGDGDCGSTHAAGAKGKCEIHS